jgi:hypothetical protein
MPDCTLICGSQGDCDLPLLSRGGVRVCHADADSVIRPESPSLVSRLHVAVLLRVRPLKAIPQLFRAGSRVAFTYESLRTLKS